MVEGLTKRTWECKPSAYCIPTATVQLFVSYLDHHDVILASRFFVTHPKLMLNIQVRLSVIMYVFMHRDTIMIHTISAVFFPAPLVRKA
jgi:hypothetical protein